MQRFLNPLLTLLILGCPISCPLRAAQCADRAADQAQAESHCCCCCPLERRDSRDSRSPHRPAPNTCQCFCSGAYNVTVQAETPCPQDNPPSATFLAAAPVARFEATQPRTVHNLPPDDRVSGGSLLRVLLQSLTC